MVSTEWDPLRDNDMPSTPPTGLRPLHCVNLSAAGRLVV